MVGLVEATLAVEHYKAKLAKAEEVLQEATHEFMLAKGRFTSTTIPEIFDYRGTGLTENVLWTWAQYNYGPQPNENGVYSIGEMHEFFWCTDLNNLPPDWRGDDYWRNFFETARLERLKYWVLDIDHLIFEIRRRIGDVPRSSKKWRGRALPENKFKRYKEKIPMFKTTSDVRTAMIKLYSDVESGKVTDRVARTKVQVAKTIVDTIKVEIAAANLGRSFGAVHFDEIEKTIDIKRVA